MADVDPDNKTRKHAEGASTVDRVVNGDSSSARVDGEQTSLTYFGMIAEPSALTYKDNALIDKDAEVPKPCLSPVEIRTPTVAGGLLLASTASTAMWTIFFHRLFGTSARPKKCIFGRRHQSRHTPRTADSVK